MSEDDFRASQHDEVEAIKAMYPGDIEVSGRRTSEFTIALYPQRGSSGGVPIANTENVTFVKLHVLLPPRYPKVYE